MDDMKKVGNRSCNDGLLLRMGLNDNKAGMQGLDKDKINKIIMEATKVCLITLLLVLYLLSSIISPLPPFPKFYPSHVNGGHLLREMHVWGERGGTVA